jgi:hypothetical protein
MRAPFRVKLARLDAGRSTAVQDELERRRRRQVLSSGLGDPHRVGVDCLLRGPSRRSDFVDADEFVAKQHDDQKAILFRGGELSFSRGSPDGNCADSLSNSGTFKFRSCSSSSSTGQMTDLSQAASMPTSPGSEPSIAGSVVANSTMSARLQAIQSSLALDDEDFSCSILSSSRSFRAGTMQPRSRITSGIPGGRRLAPIATQEQQQQQCRTQAAKAAIGLDSLSPSDPSRNKPLLRLSMGLQRHQQQAEAVA